jgi:hypothetical protein
MRKSSGSPGESGAAVSSWGVAGGVGGALSRCFACERAPAKR